MQNQSTVDLDCIYSVVQKSWAAPRFSIFCIQARFFCNFYFCLPNPSCQVAITKRAAWGKRLKLYWIEQQWIANQWWIYILNFWFKFSSLHTEEEVSREEQHRVYTTNMAEALAWYEAAFQLVVWSKLIELWMQQRSIRFRSTVQYHVESIWLAKASFFSMTAIPSRLPMQEKDNWIEKQTV